VSPVGLNERLMRNRFTVPSYRFGHFLTSSSSGFECALIFFKGPLNKYDAKRIEYLNE
jgi:hypothetical protein